MQDQKSDGKRTCRMMGFFLLRFCCPIHKVRKNLRLGDLEVTNTLPTATIIVVLVMFWATMIRNKSLFVGI